MLRKRTCKMKLALSIITGIIIFLFAVFVFPWIAIFIGLQLQPDPPLPEVKYGEFPFKLEYSIGDQKQVVNDTLICEYDAIGMNEDSGKHIKWKEHLASGNKRITLLKVEDSLEIYYPPGHARYYMGYLDSYVGYKHLFPGAAIIQKEGGLTSSGIISAEELFNRYKIKLISWDYTEPIKNSPGSPY